MIKRMMMLFAVATGAAVTGYQVIFSVPPQPELITMSADRVQEEQVCYRNPHNGPIDQQGTLTAVVWNIYKQNRSNWSAELNRLSQQAQLVLLQEASLDDDFVTWLKGHQWASSHVSAFRAFETSAGVLNLARQLPTTACAHTQKEPWLRLPKSALYATYALSNGQSLAVINVHAINFTIGTVEFRAQIDALRNAVKKHHGPMIIAGDFNTWSEERMAALSELMKTLAMKEVTFSPDSRTQFITGLVLDHIYYRDLSLIAAEAPETDASDHNPLIAQFRLLSDE